MEADSLNCMVLGDDVAPGMPEWDIFIKELDRETGQEMHGRPPHFVPENKVEEVWKALLRNWIKPLSVTR